MRTKPAFAAALSVAAILIAATADVSAATAPSRPIDAGPDCYMLVPTGYAGHGRFFHRYVSTCNTLVGRPRWGLPHLSPQNPPQLARLQPAVKMRSFVRPVGGWARPQVKR